MRSFVYSQKKHLILTGDRGSGKSTLLCELLPLFSDVPIPGIRTHAEPRCAVWLEETVTGERAQIGLYDEALPGIENRMRPCTEGFAALGVPALCRLALGGSEWVMVDEIGYLESECADYCEAIRVLMVQKRVIAVVRKQKLDFLEELRNRDDVYLIDLDEPFGTLGCVIMASGEGRRFGSNKLLADFGGEPMICRALAATEGIFAERVVVTRHREVEVLCRARGVRVVFHDLPYRSDTVRLGVEAMREEVSGCMFCPADQPLLRRETVQAMAMAACRDDRMILRLSDGDCDGAPVVFPRRYFTELANLPQGKGGGAVMKRYPDLIGRFRADTWELEDIDTEEDLARLLAANHLENRYRSGKISCVNPKDVV